jgi:hypothetical protein
MNKPDYSRYITFDGRYAFGRVQTIRKADIPAFMNMLYEHQAQYIEEAVEKSEYKEAKEVLKHIMEK